MKSKEASILALALAIGAIGVIIPNVDAETNWFVSPNETFSINVLNMTVTEGLFANKYELYYQADIHNFYDMSIYSRISLNGTITYAYENCDFVGLEYPEYPLTVTPEASIQKACFITPGNVLSIEFSKNDRYEGVTESILLNVGYAWHLDCVNRAKAISETYDESVMYDMKKETGYWIMPAWAYIDAIIRFGDNIPIGYQNAEQFIHTQYQKSICYKIDNNSIYTNTVNFVKQDEVDGTINDIIMDKYVSGNDKLYQVNLVSIEKYEDNATIDYVIELDFNIEGYLDYEISYIVGRDYLGKYRHQEYSKDTNGNDYGTLSHGNQNLILLIEIDQLSFGNTALTDLVITGKKGDKTDIVVFYLQKWGKYDYTDCVRNASVCVEYKK